MSYHVKYYDSHEYSWEEICNNAVDKPHLSPELKAKDEARYQANQYAIEHDEPNADSFDNPEEQIEYYCDKFSLFFDYNGNLINEKQMGTWNYKTSDVITVAYYDINYTPSVEEIEGTMVDYECNEKEAEDILYQQHQDYTEERFNFVCDLFKNQQFEYYSVSVDEGKYEGFQINISREQLAFDNSYQRKEMRKELTRIKNKIIVAINEYFMRVCYPGWCIGWEDTIKDSLKALNEAIKEERKVINNLKIEK